MSLQAVSRPDLNLDHTNNTSSMARAQTHGRKANGPSFPRDSQKNKSGKRKSKNSLRSKALNAFALATAELDEQQKRGPRLRQLDVQPDFPSQTPKGLTNGGKDSEDEDYRPRKRPAHAEDGNSSVDDDSDGPEWRVGVDEDDDSDIDSDNAFGDSDEENLGVSKTKPRDRSGEDSHEQEVEDNEVDDDGKGHSDGSSLGNEAIDLATALDQWKEDEVQDDDREAAREDSGSEGDGYSSPGFSADDVSDDQDDDENDSKYDALKTLIGAMQEKRDEDEDKAGPSQISRISLEDLGLTGITDSRIKKSVKFLKKEEKAVGKAGIAKKLDVPLPLRAQARLDRSAAYEKANETLDRWHDTVQQNRRSSHLVFPLAQNSATFGVDCDAVTPITQKTATNELERTVTSIMEESGLGPSAPRQAQALSNEKFDKPSNSEKRRINAELRRQREFKSREDAKAKRIKKIKSKAYRRVHRKAAKKKQMKELEALEAAGEGEYPSYEDVLEDLNRQRAIARMGGRHKQSQWAKKVKEAGRHIWDEDFKTSMKEMAQREADLQRRIDGLGDENENSDSGEDDNSESEDDGQKERKKLLAEVRELQNEKCEPYDRISKLPFIQKAEARRKAENDEALANLEKQLASDAEDSSSSDEDSVRNARLFFGRPDVGENRRVAPKFPHSGTWESVEVQKTAKYTNPEPEKPSRKPEVKSGWAQPEKLANISRHKTHMAEISAPDVAVIEKPLEKTALSLKERSKARQSQGVDDGDSSSSVEDEEPENLADDEGVSAAFAAEKAALIEEEGEKVVDKTLPGWGSWVGAGVKKRKRGHNRLVKVEGVVKKQNRKDKGLDRVMINHKKVRQVWYITLGGSTLCFRDCMVSVGCL